MKHRHFLLFPLILALLLTLTSCVLPFDFADLMSLAENSEPISLDPDGLFVLFMDVGQADCTLIMQGEHAMLIDTATSDRFDTIVEYLDLFGITKLDAMVLTHPHADHIGSAAALLEKYPVGQIFLPDAVTTTATFERTLDVILEQEIPASAPEPGDGYTFGEAYLTFLSPPPGESPSDLNDSSIAFILDYNGIGMMFTGDMGSSMEQKILEDGYDIQCDLIKVPHHGSRTASCEEFVEAVSPSWAIFFTEDHSSDGLPNQEVIDRYRDIGAERFFTHLDGSIFAEVNGSTLSVSRFDPAFVN